MIRNKTDDDKLNVLFDIIKQNSGSKILIFSEYAATAEYLYKSIQNHNYSQTALVTGNTKDKLSIIERFAPKVNTTLGHIPESSEIINILVSTDVLSEGHNLQDASVIINYDIHWNPVRLIQRIGRIDRIGTEFDKIHIFNFLPEGGIEKILHLKERVQERVNSIHQLLGEDGHIFTADDTFSEDSYTRIYVDKDDTILDDDMGEESELEKGKRLINKIKVEDPKKYNYIKNLTTGIRCGRVYHQNYVYVFALSDDGVPLLKLHNPDDKKDITNIETILKKIKAQPEEDEIQLNDSDKRAIYNITKKMIDVQQRIDNEKAENCKEKRLLYDRIRNMYSLFESDDINNETFKSDYGRYSSSIIEFLENISSHKYIKKIKDIHRLNIESDVQLFKELKLLYFEHNSEIKEEMKIERVYKVICSEVLRGE